ncbi:SpaA isopeptide-forming pilin-related protein [Faecalibacterium hattorii]|uniref:SpaA isopeptide-forming pilin-related protein n=1 Tax=Faecalibacterium hattorii TaxID=2935520 RepID=UPI003AAE198E
MKSIRKRLAAVLAALTLLVWCAAPAFALEVVDLSRTGSIKVSLYDSETSEAVGGGTLTLYRVAKVQKDNANLSFVYTNGFEDCGVELGDLSEGELAGRLAEKIAATAESTTVEISDLGIAEFGDLEVGLYLVVQTTAAENYNVINPFLVSVPIQENGSYVYDVDALPKVGTAAKKTPEPPDTPDTPDTPDKPEEENPNTPAAPGPNNPDSWVLGANGEKIYRNPEAPSPDNPNGHVMGAHGLPQTGQLNWPIPVLAVTGVVLVAAGIKLKKGTRKDEK